MHSNSTHELLSNLSRKKNAQPSSDAEFPLFFFQHMSQIFLVFCFVNFAWTFHDILPTLVKPLLLG